MVDDRRQCLKQLASVIFYLSFTLIVSFQFNQLII